MVRGLTPVERKRWLSLDLMSSSSLQLFVVYLVGGMWGYAPSRPEAKVVS